MRSLIYFLIGLSMFSEIKNLQAQTLFELEKGRIDFVSEAPLELIEADNESFKFLLDTAKNEFAVSIPISTFNGFNSALQREHFFENYMEIDRYEYATFAGKILDELSFQTGSFVVMVRGELNIHGIKKERIIEATCEWESRDKLKITSTFNVPLSDHNIDVPRIVFQKIAEVIKVKIQADLVPKI